ncbi:MAG: putative exosortase interaction protein [Planctomycetota bacterium]|nr:putative exosortase interaction protein [Planctomycetota bacterium]
MHRMQRYIVLTGFVGLVLGLGGSRASADLLHPSTDPQKYPDIIANLGKGVSYTYDSSAQQGVFHLKNTAYVLVTGTKSTDEWDISAAPDGSRFQVLNVTLDKNGSYVNDPGNLYQVYGSVTANGQTFSGLLLQGKPIDFATSNVGGVTQFQSNLKLDGSGALASFFGPDSYIHLIAETGNGFKGSFTDNWTISKVSSNTHGPNVIPQPFPVPEPTALILIAASGVGLVYRHRRRLA